MHSKVFHSNLHSNSWKFLWKHSRNTFRQSQNPHSLCQSSANSSRSSRNNHCDRQTISSWKNINQAKFSKSVCFYASSTTKKKEKLFIRIDSWKVEQSSLQANVSHRVSRPPPAGAVAIPSSVGINTRGPVTELSLLLVAGAFSPRRQLLGH